MNAVVRGQAPCEDLAVIELNPQPRGLKTAKLGRSAGLKAGDDVTALGFPGAFEDDITNRRLQSTEGTISSKPGPATLGGTLPNLPAVIQHQAPISPGNSGGPLFNDTGQVIGINTLAATSESGAQNQNGAIAIDRARSLLPSLEQGDDRAYVGWSLQNISIWTACTSSASRRTRPPTRAACFSGPHRRARQHRSRGHPRRLRHPRLEDRWRQRQGQWR